MKHINFNSFLPFVDWLYCSSELKSFLLAQMMLLMSSSIL